jgi:hypothetical protein
MMVVRMKHNYQQLKVLVVMVDNQNCFLYVWLNDIEDLVLFYIVLDKNHR